MMATKRRAVKVHIRWMIRRDMPEVLEIEKDSFEFPWTEEDFIRCVRQRNCIGMVAEFKEEIVGYMVYELHKSRVHLLSFATHPDFRYRSVGRQLVDKLKSKLRDGGRCRITLEVRETNLDAQLFFQQCGFAATAVLEDYYFDRAEDAYVMEYHVSEQSPQFKPRRQR